MYIKTINNKTNTKDKIKLGNSIIKLNKIGIVRFPIQL